MHFLSTIALPAVLCPPMWLDVVFLCVNILITLHLFSAGIYLTFEGERYDGWLRDNGANLLGILMVIFITGIMTSLPTDGVHLFAMMAFVYTWVCHYKRLSIFMP